MACLDKEIHAAVNYGNSVFSGMTMHSTNPGTKTSHDMWKAFEKKTTVALGDFVNDVKERIRTLRNSHLETYQKVFGASKEDFGSVEERVVKLVAAKDHKGLLDLAENFSDELDCFFSRMRKTFKIVTAACDIAEVRMPITTNIQKLLTLYLFKSTISEGGN